MGKNIYGAHSSSGYTRPQTFETVVNPRADRYLRIISIRGEQKATGVRLLVNSYGMVATCRGSFSAALVGFCRQCGSCHEQSESL